jgi:hypothetical protein
MRNSTKRKKTNDLYFFELNHINMSNKLFHLVLISYRRIKFYRKKRKYCFSLYDMFLLNIKFYTRTSLFLNMLKTVEQ